MTLKVGINGFGRIGRNILRALTENQIQDIEIVRINDLCETSTAAHLLCYDSIHGRFGADVAVEGGFQQKIQSGFSLTRKFPS